MKISSHLILQVLMILAQILTWATSILPARYQPAASGALAIVQGATGLLNHYFNPNGTPAAQSYKPEQQ